MDLCNQLADDMGRPVTAVLAHAPSALAEDLGDGRADFAWMSPTLLLMSSRLSTVVPLLSSVREGRAMFHSVVFTSQQSEIQSVRDLEGVRAAWVAPTSASGYIVPRLTLARWNVDLARAIDENEFLDSHGAVARAVLEGDADIGATYAHFERGSAEGRLLATGYTDELPGAECRVLAVGGPIPADMIVAHPSVSIRDRIAFAAALSRLSNCAIGAQRIGEVIGAEGFVAVSHEALAELDALMRAGHED